MKILVSGGTGYIGSVVTEELLKGGHEPVVFDNLSQCHRAALHRDATFVEGDLLDRARRSPWTICDNGSSASRPRSYSRNCRSGGESRRSTRIPSADGWSPLHSNVEGELVACRGRPSERWAGAYPGPGGASG